MVIDSLRYFSALVGNGSGCFFQPMTDSYTYILTTKHNINHDGTIELQRYVQNAGKWEVATLTCEYEIFEHPNLDATIIKIPFLDGYDKLYCCAEALENAPHYYLAGYANIRNITGSEDRFRINNGVTFYPERPNGLIEAALPGNPTFEEIEGQSGGGYFMMRNTTLLLCAIQKGVIPGQESLGRVEAVPIAAFHEIAAINNLAPLLPPYMKCFSFLKSESFALNAGIFQESIDYTVNFLRRKADLVVQSSITPIAIKEYFKKRLLVYNQGMDVLNLKRLWRMWLEFLVIMNIVSDRLLDQAELIKIFDSYRLLYADTTDDWLHDIESLVKCDFKGLKFNDVVVIATNGPSAQLFFPKKIGRGRVPRLDKAKRSSSEGMLIDEGIDWPLDNFKFVHINALYRTIEDKAEEYEAFEPSNDRELLEKLKYEYEQLFG